MGSCCSSSSADGPHDGIESEFGENDNSSPIVLPPGWKAVPSRSRPGKVAYQNIHTGERIAWVPTEEAKTFKGGISKKKKKAPKKEDEAPGLVSESTAISMVDNSEAKQITGV